MSPSITRTPGSATWDLAYDSAWFLPLPTSDELSADPAAEDAWVDGVLAHYADRAPVTDGDREALALTARGLLAMVDDAATQLWFVPPGAYSDVLIGITVGDVEGLDPDRLLAEIGSLPDATASDMIGIDTDNLGTGVLVRRTSAAMVDDVAVPIANWTVVLRKGEWVTIVEAMGSTLETFAALEQHLPRLLAGISLPDGIAP